MITKIYESPAVDVFNFAAEAGFQASTAAAESEIAPFGATSGKGDDDWE